MHACMHLNVIHIHYYIEYKFYCIHYFLPVMYSIENLAIIFASSYIHILFSGGKKYI